MKRYYKITLVAFFLGIAVNGISKASTPVGGNTRYYASPQKEGLIGMTEQIPFDNPADNIFHFTIDDPLCDTDAVWLTYELDGVIDHTSVSRSINDQLSVGGYVIKKRAGWITQRERISGSWIRVGDNIVRFTVPANATHHYKIKNVRLEVESNVLTTASPRIIINQPSQNYFFDQAYVKGFVSGDFSQVASLSIDGREVKLYNGEFESLLPFRDRENCSVAIEMVLADGSVACETVLFTEPISSDYEFDASTVSFKAEQLFLSSDHINLTLQGAQLSGSTGALKTTEFISITSLRDFDIVPMDGGLINVTKYASGFRFLPHGTTFNQSVNVAIQFDPEKIPDGYTAEDIRTFYFDEKNHHWLPLPLDTLLTEANLIVSRTTHFTDMITGILKVPESPEVDAYSSTSIKGIKAANPSAAVNLIDPPQANTNGSASLTFPIVVPAGRAGLQPQLALNYNSSSNNGWLGMGWNLSLPSITIETRWGVPRYDSIKETETYMMNGDMLTPVAHRDLNENRSTGDKRFFPRIEGMFNKIIRHGNNPSNYWWEVTDKNGTKYSYGGRNGAFDINAVLRTKEGASLHKGNVSQWCLREVRDLNGNTLLYEYEKVANPGVPGGTDGHQIYIKKIYYTGHNGSEGPYQVSFSHERELFPAITRPDIPVMGTLGFKQVTADRLKEIRVKFENENIRSYRLEYKTGAFEKSLLERIVERDAKDNDFTTHEFSYYDEVDAEHGYKPYTPSKNYNTFDDDINGGFLNKNLSFNDKASFLAGSQSTSIGGGLAVTVGPYTPNLATKSNTAGINYSYSHSTSEGRVQMIDMNGDGLPDKLIMYKNGRRKELKYRAQIKNDNGTISYGDLRPVNGMDEFLKESSNSHDFGIESNFGIFAGLNYSINKSKTSIYFTDVNGDGLVDLVREGKVMFNHLNESGDPTFSNTSDQTPNPISTGAALDGNLINVDPNEVALLLEQNPLHDMVRMWRAPFDGEISIYAPVALIKDTTEERAAYTTADGVRVAIQLKNQELLLDSLDADDYQPTFNDTLRGITVTRGDRLYFRVHSVEDGAYDKVLWNPVIKYNQHNDTLRDANKNHLYLFNAKNDFLLAADQALAMPINGRVRIQSAFSKPLTSDSVLVEIISDRNGAKTSLFSKHYAGAEQPMESISFDADVNEEEKIIFKASSNTNIDWTALSWKSLISYTQSYDTIVRDVVDETGKLLVNLYPIPQYSVLANQVRKPIAWTSPTTDTLQVTPKLNFKTLAKNGEVIFSVKKYDSLLAKQFLVIKDTIATEKFSGESPLTMKVPVKIGDKLFFEFHTAELGLAIAADDAKATIRYSDTTVVHEAGLYTRIADAERIFGPMYRNWGMFAYNGNDGKGVLPIDENALKVNTFNDSPPSVDLSNASSEDEMNDSFNSSGGYKANKDAFVLMLVDAKKERWIGNDELTFIQSDTVSSSRMGLDQISLLFPELSQGAGVAFAVDKITKSNQTSLAASGGGIGANGSTGNSRVITDFIDMNGDKHPDILGEYKIQYSLPQGGLEDQAKNHSWEFGHRTKLLAGGISAGGSFSKSGKEANSAPKNSAFSSIGEATSFSLSALWSKDDAEYTWMDMNGDGLPDRVNAETGKVALNLGYKFAPEESWGNFFIRNGSSQSVSGGLGINIKNYSIAGGVSISRSDNTLKETLLDVNGDGLPDKVSGGSGSIVVYFNTGSGFSSTPFTWSEFSDIGKGAATSWSANVAFTIGIPLIPPVLVAKLCINPKVYFSKGFNRQQIQISDIDGDGSPDYLSSSTDDEVSVAKSTIGRTNLLKHVKRPLGAAISMTYARLGNTFEMPNNTWVLDSVTMHDGFVGDGVDSMLTTYEYRGGFYNRRERDFFGFGTVVTRSHDTSKKLAPVYTTLTQTFGNTSYYDKGLLLKEVMTDAEDRIFSYTENKYELKNITNGNLLSATERLSDSGNAFPALVEVNQKFYEGHDEPGKSTVTRYAYDEFGNVKTYTDFGDPGTEDDISSTITYHNISDLHLVGVPLKISVQSNGQVFRQRESTINQTTGNITSISKYLSETEIATYDMEYDAYGNLTKILRPENANGQRLAFEYEYDDRARTYTTKIKNSYGYSSMAEYDLRFGQVLKSTDRNGNEIRYEIDDLGRWSKIIGPYEKNSGYTITFSYAPNAVIPWALTNHFDPSNPSNALRTVTFIDGLGRLLQTKKDAAIFEGDGKSDKEMMVVTGRVEFDAFGRATSARYPILEPVGKPTEFNSLVDQIDATTTTYDVLNRVLSTTLPDKSKSETVYGFGADRDGKVQFSKKAIDANGKQTEEFLDLRGQITAVKNYTSDDPIWTSFKYNPINEQIEATDDLGHSTYSVYDNFGRRIQRTHPDAGTTNYTFDLAGNLTELNTENLSKEGKSILYSYEFERLKEITYPDNTENNVRYTYGAAGATDNRVGRIVLQEDASGAQEFFYGPLGEVLKNVRTIIIPQHDEQTYVMEWKYDTWNRLTSMTYADGEEVTYQYNVGGLLRSMAGKKKNEQYAYVNQIGYDKFEQSVFLAYGNGTKTNYQYEPERRRLKSMTAASSAKRVFMDNAYTYDKVNNILSVKNNAAIPSPNLMGGSSDYTYQYDDLYRLISAEGSYAGANDQQSFTLSMSYNSVGGIIRKEQLHKRKDQEQKKTSYTLDYAYGDEQPHAPIHIGDQSFSYDANGNQTGWEDDRTGQQRKILWDEENRIRAIFDNGAQNHYVYDASGERVLKGKSTGQRVFVNGEWKAGSGQMGNYTVYVNPYLVLRSGSYTKHYYIEGQRIVSKLGGGFDTNGKGPLKAGENSVDYATKGQKLFDGIVKNLKFLGADGQILTAGKSGKVPPGQINGGTGGNVTEAFRYFYHPDHLGSTSYVTDASGEVFQHLEYMPFGETFVEEHSNTDRVPYLFNGKELDEETGLYYYGARYYDARTSVWLTIDPMTYQHPNASPFAYVYNNPVKLIDPVGMDSTQRANALAQAQKYIDLKPEGNQYLMGAKGAPGEKVDCSGFVSNSVMAGGEKDPNRGSETSGVLNIEKSTTEIDAKDVVPGNIVTFRNSSGYAYHTGIVKSVERDASGNITSVTYLHSSGGKGPNEKVFTVGDSGNLSIHGYYKWDTKPDPKPKETKSPVTATGNVNANTPSTATNYQSNSSRGSTNFLQKISSGWENIKYEFKAGMSQMENRLKTGFR